MAELTGESNYRFKEEYKDVELDPIPTVSEKRFFIKEEGLDVKYTEEEPYFHIEDEFKDWNINNRNSEEVLIDGNIENQQKVSAPWPLFMCSSKFNEASVGVCTGVNLPKGLIFGPYEGRILNKIQDNGSPGVCIGSVDMTVSNSLNFVSCAQTYEEANLVIFQYKEQIYYKTVIKISRGTELMVWCSNEPGRVLGVCLENHKENSAKWVKRRKVSCVEFYSASSLFRKYNSAEINHNHSHTNFSNNISNDMINQNKNENNSQCDKAFNNSGHLKKHLQISGKKPYGCTQCDKTFNHSSSLKRHLRIHSGEKHHICDQCDKAFSDSSYLKRHLHIHSGERPYKCDKCDKAFNLLSNLKNHLQIHSGERPYNCTQCDRTFNQLTSLKRHLQIHSGGKPYKCDQCDKAFNQFGNLEKHLRIHSGKKPYLCDQCNKAFTESGHLKRHHLRIHSGEKPYMCNQCDKAFAESRYLKRHLQIHSGEKPYKCAHCDKAFYRFDVLKTHLQIHSGERENTKN